MEEMQIFMNEKFGQIRTKEINGEPWFCLADVCKPLGIRAKDCKLRLKQGGVDTIALPTKSGTQNMLIINEGNLYRAIFQSKKPEAEAFTDWVTEEILPALRRNGSYTAKSKSPDVSLNGLANLVRVTRRGMLDMGSTPQQVGYMVKDMFSTWNVPIPASLEMQCPGQICLTAFQQPPLLAE